MYIARLVYDSSSYWPWWSPPLQEADEEVRLREREPQTQPKQVNSMNYIWITYRGVYKVTT